MRQLNPEIVLENIPVADTQPLIRFFQIKFPGVVKTASPGFIFLKPRMQWISSDLPEFLKSSYAANVLGGSCIFTVHTNRFPVISTLIQDD